MAKRKVHEYLSTACLHGQCHYCEAMIGFQGIKRPAQCKFCDARCSCHCHRAAAEGDPHRFDEAG